MGAIRKTTRNLVLLCLTGGLVIMIGGLPAFGAATDLATAPLITSAPTLVLPNLMVVFDDSGSMTWTHMPDTVEGFTGSSSRSSCSIGSSCEFGYRSSQCNGVYYDPTVTYTPPVDSAGAAYANAVFTRAKIDGYDGASLTIDLSRSFYAYDQSTTYNNVGRDTAQPAYYYRYTGTETAASQKLYNTTGSLFYRECNSKPSDYGLSQSAPYNRPPPFELVRVTGTAEEQNFANWFSYYRTRVLMMKTALGTVAYNLLDSSYRVGFTTLFNSASTQAFLDWAPFDGAAKTSWYNTLYGLLPQGSTPLRTTLSNVGRMYARKLTSITVDGTTTPIKDPVQYSCQKNFTLLSTDGYWNDASNPKQLNGSTDIGNQDNTLQRPFYDGGGSSASNSLADVAQYYYATDLRTSALSNCTGALGSGLDVCRNNVPVGPEDPVSAQHMATFTLGLGAPGRMIYSPSYLSDGSGDYFSVRNGRAAPANCSWQTSGSVCNWPIPASGAVTAIDDLWHAAVNGRGKYYTATNAKTLADSLFSAFAEIVARRGSVAAAVSSNPNLSAGSDFVLASAFNSGGWYGDLYAKQIDIQAGTLKADMLWQQTLDGMDYTQRTILTYDDVKQTLAPFASYVKGNAALLTTYFNSDAALVDYLVGDASNEGVIGSSKPFRPRVDAQGVRRLLGDIVHSEIVYVKKPLYNYTDEGYDDYTADHSNRMGAAYVGANDGMLHAFATETLGSVTAGDELWAYVPGPVLPNLRKLADKKYQYSHQYFVDGTPLVGDAYFAGAWHTVLIGGLNSGGKGYYALDITNPQVPKLLWEISSATPGFASMGYSFGNPVITKTKTGQWVALVTSGYNNHDSRTGVGDGKGHLFVIDVGTGQLLREISTLTGSAETPSGLAKIVAWSDNAEYDNTALRVYGGDLLGNVWRFDINGDVGAAGYDAQLLVRVQDATGKSQPITTRPEITEINGKAVVYVGTGQYLGLTDLADSSQQSFYAIKDELGTTTYANPRTVGSLFVQQTLTNGTCPTGTDVSICTSGQAVRTASRNAVDFSTQNGWYVDLPETGERVNVDPVLALGILAFNSNTPSNTACAEGGTSMRYFLDAATGGALSSVKTSVAGSSLGNVLSSRPFVIQTPSSKVGEVISGSGGTTVLLDMPKPPIGASTRRVSWRELPTE
jgi:type IV pilus assembly protein PilY1